MLMRMIYFLHYTYENKISLHHSNENQIFSITKKFWFTAVMKTRFLCIGNDWERVFANDGNEIIKLFYFILFNYI